MDYSDRQYYSLDSVQCIAAVFDDEHGTIVVSPSKIAINGSKIDFSTAVGLKAAA